MRKRRFMGVGFAVLTGLLLLSVADESVAGAHLVYERLGYQSGVESLVDAFLANVAADERVNGRFADTDMAKLRGHLIDQVCEATDGPCTYEGKSMREAHAGMGITEAEFAIIAGHFAAAMEQAGVNASDHATVMSLLSAMQDDIVGQ
ncbi:MAG: group 1 truncated hemoglobin [Candidatus Tectomicrobia bacterium]|nr:group 1 truncated hemoglobin [Candidatus Tectomicrobia bacterium]